MTPGARLAAAIDLLAAIEAAPRKPADAVANAFFRERRFIGSGDRRAVSERVWTTLRHFRRLSWRIAEAGGEPGPRLLTAAGLLADGWTVEGTVQQFSGNGFGPSRLSAAEQRTLAQLAARPPDAPGMPEAVRLELPDFLLPAFRARFGDALEAEVRAMERPAPVDLRVNTLKTTREAAQAALAEEGHEARPTQLSPWGLRLQGRRSLTGGQAFQDGLVEIQDEGSQLVAALVGAAPGMRVADFCAGAGGKTLAMAAMMGNRGHIAACDVSAVRLEAMVKRLRRAGIHNAERHRLMTGDKWAKRHQRSFDRVLVDAPCTGSGTWRRNPDARLRLREQDLAELLEKQASILDSASALVRPGGRLVYATCSLLADENEGQVERFLAAHAGWTIVPVADAWRLPSPPPVVGDALALTPARHGTDGFFAAVLERAA